MTSALEAPRIRREGSWIWPTNQLPARLLVNAVPPSATNVIAHFRNTVDGSASAADLEVFADTRYRLWVNGAQIGRGPVRSHPTLMHLDSYSLSSHLKPGPNLICLEVRFYGELTPWSTPVTRFGNAGLGGLLVHADDPAVESGAHWVGRIADCVPGPRETGVHGAALEHWTSWDEDWLTAVEHPAAFQPCVELVGGSPLPTSNGFPAAPFHTARHRPIAALTHDLVAATTVVCAGELTADSDDAPVPRVEGPVSSGLVTHRSTPGCLPTRLPAGGFVTLDLGRVVVGVPTVELVAGEAATTVRLWVGEALDEMGLPEVRPRSWAARFDLQREQRANIAPFDGLGLRYLAVHVESPATILSAAVLEERCPVLPGAAFRSSDDDLNRLWLAGARTREVCSTDAYIDCPTREDRAWLGDLVVPAKVGTVVDPDRRMTAWAIELAAQRPRVDGLLPVVAVGDLADYPDVIPDYSLHWIRALRSHVWDTGDIDIARRLLGRVDGVLRWFLERIEGGRLGAPPGWIFLDSHPVTAGRSNAGLQALLVAALNDAADLGTWGGTEEWAKQWSETSEILVTDLEEFWDPAAGVYRDCADGPPVVSQRVQALMIIAGAAPPSRWPSMLDRVLEPSDIWTPPGIPAAVRGQRLEFVALPEAEAIEGVIGVSLFYRHFLHEALARANRWDDLFASLTALATLAGSDETMPEHAQPLGYLSSHCHAWSSTATYDLSTYVAGVSPTAPGWKRVRVAPQLGPLTEVACRIPTPVGLVEVDLSQSGGKVAAEVVLPEGVVGEFVLDGTTALPSGRTRVRT